MDRTPLVALVAVSLLACGCNSVFGLDPGTLATTGSDATAGSDTNVGGDVADDTADFCFPVINEVQVGSSTTPDSFVELYNPCEQSFDLKGYYIGGAYPSGPDAGANLIELTGSIDAGGFMVFVQKGSQWDGSAPAFAGNYAVSISQFEGVAFVKDGALVPIDAVAWFPGNPAVEGDPAVAPQQPDQSIARSVDGFDTDSNKSDFSVTTTVTPGTSNKITTP